METLQLYRHAALGLGEESHLEAGQALVEIQSQAIQKLGEVLKQIHWSLEYLEKCMPLKSDSSKCLPKFKNNPKCKFILYLTLDSWGFLQN